MGKIKTKPVSKELQNKAKPQSGQMRSSLSDENIGEFYYIDADRIVPYRHQPRQHFDDDELQALAETIQKHGIRQPLTVILNQDTQYEVVSGERRLRAAKKIGLKKVPCLIIQDEGQAEELALIENMQRADLHPVEVGVSLSRLVDKGMSQKDIAEKLALGKSKVSELLKFGSLSEEIRTYLIDHNITSREVLRDIVAGKSDLESLKTKMVSAGFDQNARSKSIFRVGLMNGEYKIQKGSLSSLTRDQRQKLKRELNLIIKNHLSE